MLKKFFSNKGKFIFNTVLTYLAAVMNMSILFWLISGHHSYLSCLLFAIKVTGVFITFATLLWMINLFCKSIFDMTR